ncbi:hypothetical protein AB0K00_54750 [Dactylosporangium sp. NPDC049525]|uniref:hypothetical protein n=1 Tax=Dactylosporangium sp. NPDC049525 TaxID=3154730 RepID=UPI00343151F5
MPNPGTKQRRIHSQEHVTAGIEPINMHHTVPLLNPPSHDTPDATIEPQHDLVPHAPNLRALPATSGPRSGALICRGPGALRLAAIAALRTPSGDMKLRCASGLRSVEAALTEYEQAMFPRSAAAAADGAAFNSMLLGHNAAQNLIDVFTGAQQPS